MPREESPLPEGNRPLVEFARTLRLLREKAGKPTYRVLSARAHYSEAALSQAGTCGLSPGLLARTARMLGTTLSFTSSGCFSWMRIRP